MKNTVKNFAAATILILAVMFSQNNVQATELPAWSNETETLLSLENWMTNDAMWNTNVRFAEEFAILETEELMEVENWMTNSNTWNNTMDISVEMDNQLELESWMMDEQSWEVNIIEADDTLSLESWMTDENIWE